MANEFKNKNEFKEEFQRRIIAVSYTHLMDISALTYTGFRSNAYSAGMCVIALAAVVYFIFRNSKEKRALGIMTLLITILPLFCYILNGLQYVREKSLIPMIPLIGYMIAEML